MNRTPALPANSFPNTPVTLFIADDHRIVRDGMKALAERHGGFQVVGEAGDGRQLVDGVRALNPDVVVTDMSMEQLNGIEATRQLRDHGFTGIIVMFSMHDERRIITQALQAGVSAYVHKDHAFDQIMTAIEAARSGKLWLSPQLAGLADGGRVPTLLEILTPREREVLQLLAEGLGTKEVAAKLDLSPKTIEVFRLKLFSKLKCNNVIELTRIAIKEDLVQL
jgi:DNA-binding NarL/FixJ family response regulator